jgi:hypothetical protein
MVAREYFHAPVYPVGRIEYSPDAFLARHNDTTHQETTE